MCHHRSRSICHLTLGESGKPQEARALFDEHLIRSCYQGPIRPKLMGLYALTLAACGLVTDALQVVKEAHTYAAERVEHYYDAELHRIEGDLTLLRGRSRKNVRAAEGLYTKAIGIARNQHAAICELRALCSLIRLYSEHDRLLASSCLRDLRSLYGQFNEGLQTADLVACRTLLGHVEAL